MPLFPAITDSFTSPGQARRRSHALKLATAPAQVEAMESRVLLAMPTLWTTTGPGGGGATLSAVISPDGQDLWCSSDMSGIYHSRDYGQTWQMLNFHNSVGGINGGTFSQVRFTSDPNILYIASTNAGPVKSMDRGTTWTPLSGWAGGGAYWMATDLSTTTKILVTDGTGLYLSTNGGTSFTTAYASSNLFVAGAFFDGNNVYVGTNKGFLTSSDGGASFTLAAQQPANTNIMSFTGAKQGGTVRLMAMTTSNANWDGYSPADLNYDKMFRLDVGGSWVDVSSGIGAGEDPNFVSMAQNNINIVYTGGGDPAGRTQVLKSTDGGTTFSDTFFTRPWDVTPNVPNANVATGYEGQGGDFDWSFGGAAWGFSVCQTDVNKVIISDAWVHVTTDGGTTWHQVYENQSDSNPMGQFTPQHKAYAGMGPTMTSVHYIEWTSPTNIMAGYTDIDGWRSTDGGTSWSHPDFNGVVVNTLYKTIYSGGLLYGATSNVHDMYQSTHLTDAQCNPGWQTGAVVVSADQGATWSNIHSFGVPILWIQLDPNNPNRMYAAAVDGVGSNGGIWVTNNLNAGVASTWTKLANPPRTEGHAYTVQVLNDGTLVATYSGRMSGGVFTNSSGVFISTDGGATWVDRTGPTMHWYTMELTVDPTDASQNTWYAGVNNAWGGNGNGMGDLYRTTDRGVTWTRMNLAPSFGIAFLDVHGVTINPATNEMYVVSGNSGLGYAPDVTVSGFSAANITDVTSFPFGWSERAFINPNNSQDVWVATFGGGAIRGGVAPSNLVGTPAGMTQINLTWSDNSSNETGFAIDRATDPGFTQNLATGTAGMNATSAAITGLNAGTTYYFRIRATSGANKSANSSTASATTLNTPIPVAPSGLSTTIISQTQINLSWLDNSNNEDGFYIDRAGDSGFSSPITSTVGANVSTFSATGLTANTTYYFRVRSFNTNGESANSNTASATTLTNVPAAPSGLSASAISSSRIDLSWTDNSNNETGFSIDRATNSGFSSNLVTTPVGPNTSSYSVTGLTATTTYYFRVRASSIWGSSANSAAASATTLDVPPSSPSGLSASTISQTQINLSWTDNSNNELGFYIDQASDSGFSSGLITSTVGANVTSLNVMGLASASTYYFRVRSYSSAGGASTNSATASATTLPFAPTAPSVLAATVVSSTRIDLSWTDNSNNEAGFYLDRATDSGFGSNLVTSTIAANMTTASATGLSSLSTYYFRVRAYNSGGLSANSAAASATTLDVPPTAPSGLAASTISQTQINLSWTDNSNNELGFYIDEASDSGFSSGLITSTVGANVTSLNVMGLASASTYYFRVRSYSSAGGASTNSATASATTLPFAPTAPSVLAATVVSSTRIDLSWTDNSNNEAGFYLDRATDSGFGSNLVTSTIAANMTTASATGLSSLSTYYFRLRAYNSGGSSANSAAASATTLDVPPSAPSGLAASAVSQTQINLSWLDNSNNELGFYIDEASDSGFSSGLITATVGANVTSLNVTGLASASTYYFRVRSYNGVNPSANDIPVSATTLAYAPTDISLSNASVPENQPIDTVVGALTSSDLDAGDSFSYSLVAGAGAEDNGSFAISGNELVTAASFNYEFQSSYSVRIRTTDAWGLSFEKAFTITVTDANDAPTDIALSNASVPENQPAGTFIGSLSTTDEDADDSFTYSLVAGAGADDNGSFAISGNELVTATPLDYELQGNYSVRIRSTDSGGLSFDKVFTITVTNVNEVPTDIQLSNSSVAEDQPIGTEVGTLSGVSSNAGDTFSYSLVDGAGSDDNSSFSITDDRLSTATTFSYIPGRTYTARVRATASTGLWVEMPFTIDVNSLPEFGMTGGKKPTSLSIADADGDMVTFKLSGGGLGALLDNQLSLIGTTSKSSLKISVKKSKTGDGQYVVGNITSDGLIKSINAKSLVLNGQVLLNSLEQSPGKASVSLTFQRVHDGKIEVMSLPLKSVSLLDWQDTDETPDTLQASSIGSITVKGRKASRSVGALPGDLDANVIVSGGIKSIRVAGTLAGDVTVGTKIDSIKAGKVTGTITQGAGALLQSGALYDVLAELNGTFAG